MNELPTVIVIDDEPIVCERLKPALEKAGLQVETYTESKAAQRRLEEKTFDVVVTDLKMNELSGIQILKNVRAASAQTAVIIITGYATVEMAREALKIGAYDFIAKPFKIRDLRNLILKALQERGLKISSPEQ
ncbi:MAG: response regulator [Desulfobacteraceae bacterium]|nr:MAG: response regulator [Desulfobacteraceae bacterium]